MGDQIIRNTPFQPFGLCRQVRGRWSLAILAVIVLAAAPLKYIRKRYPEISPQAVRDHRNASRLADGRRVFLRPDGIWIE